MSRLVASLVAVTCSLASPVRADVVVVPVTDSDALDASTQSCAATVESVLKSKGPSGPLVLTDRQLASSHSRALVSASSAQLAAFRSAADRAHEGLDPRADFRAVLTHMAEVQELVDAAPESYNLPERRRETKSACLGAASTLRRHEQPEVAVELAAWCLFSLDLAPHEHFAPPELMPTFHEAERALAAQAGGELVVRVLPSEGCSTVINGATLNGPASGGRGATYLRPYSVHVSCVDGRKSRVHVVTPRPDIRTELAIDLAFDAALRIDARRRPYLADEAASASLAAHLRELAAVARVPEAIAVTHRRGSMILRRIAANEDASTAVPEACDAAAVDKALALLRTPAFTP